MVVERPNFVRTQQTEGAGSSNQGDSHSTSAERTRRLLSPETREKIRAARIGKKHTAEARAKMSESKKGKSPKPFSPEHRVRLSESHKGKSHSPESRAKMSETKKGKPLSPETRTK